jgi:hypothetical protein
MEQVVAEVRKYDRNSLLWVCAEIVCRVQLWSRPAGHNRPNYLQYLRDFFDPMLSERMIAGAYSTLPVRLLFHRRQIGLIAKLAVKHGREGLDAREHRSALGMLFLMANDQLDHGLLRTLSASGSDLRAAAVCLVTEMVAVQEGASPNIANLFTRGHLMLTRYAKELSEEHDYVDIVGEFERQVGMSLSEFEAMVFAVHARFCADFSNKIVTDPSLLPLKIANFGTTAISEEKAQAFLRFVSSTSDDLKKEIEQSDNGANDATPFRKHPMVHYSGPPLHDGEIGYLMMDNLAFLEKAQTEAYWAANAADSENLRSFWGTVFEMYVNDLVSRACAGTTSRFFPDPRQRIDPSVQICDGILVANNAVVLMEYKASMFRADNKYCGDPTRLLKEIEKKWVRNEKGSKKGVEQLAAAVKLLFENNNPGDIFPDVDWSKIDEVHLCLVTLDSLGETFGMSALLNTYLPEGLNFTHRPAGLIRPLHCVDIASLERATGHFGAMSLPQMLSLRLQLTTDLSASLSMVDFGSPQQNPWINTEWETIGRQIVPLVFPGTDMDQFFAGIRANYERVARELAGRS